MGDRIAGAQAARAQLARDARLRKQIILRAYAVTGNMADANDLAQQAMMRAIDPEGSPWDPAREPSLLVHLGSLINSRLANLRRGAGRHPVDPFDEAAVPTDQPGPEASILARDARAEFEAWLVELQRRLDGDGIALAKLDWHSKASIAQRTRRRVSAAAWKTSAAPRAASRIMPAS